MDYGGDGFDVLRVSIGLPVAVLAACPVDGACADYFVRTNETRSRGVNDPRPTGPGTGFGGWQRGSFTPRLSLHCRRGLTAHATRGTKRRAISVSPTRSPFNNMRDTRSDRHVPSSSATGLAARTRRGNAPPESVFPPPFRRSAGYAEPTRGVRWA